MSEVYQDILPTVPEENSINGPAGMAKTKSGGKFKIHKVLKSKQPHLRRKQSYPVPFNDPLYEYLDNEVYDNKEEHNLGPWVEMKKEKMKEHQANHRSTKDLPTLSDIRARYMNDLGEAQEVEGSGLAIIRSRSMRSSSLREIKASSLQFQPGYPANSDRPKEKTPLKLPPHLKTGGKHLLPHAGIDSIRRKSEFIYNYGMNEQEMRSLQMKLRTNNGYLLLGDRKLAPLTNYTNEMLFKQLKQHRSNRVK